MDCAICLEEILVANSAGDLRTPCGHYFHDECLNKWLDFTPICPICRYTFPAGVPKQYTREQWSFTVSQEGPYEFRVVPVRFFTVLNK